jgi:hypothetical protein
MEKPSVQIGWHDLKLDMISHKVSSHKKTKFGIVVTKNMKWNLEKTILMATKIKTSR